jgi:hypothetical protein
MDRLVLPMGSVDFRREEVRTPHGSVSNSGLGLSRSCAVWPATRNGS